MRKILIFTVVIVGGLFLANVAGAWSISLSISTTGNPDYAQITVYGDADSGITLYYQNSGYGTQSRYIGSTNSSGYYSGVINSADLNIANNSSVYVIVNGYRSADVVWPYSGSGVGNISLSQGSLTLQTGQTSTVTVYNTGSSIYISNNSNSSVASAYTNSNQINITANNYGSTTITVCAGSYSSNCAYIYVTVQSSQGNTGPTTGDLSLSRTSVDVQVGGSQTVTIYGSGTLYKMYPSTPNVFRSMIVGNTLTITGKENGSGTLNVCSTIGFCNNVNVTVGNGNNNNNNNWNGQVTFGQTNPNLYVGQNLDISLSGSGGGYYYIAYNSNSNLISATVNSSTLSLRGLTNGSGAVVVCTSNSGCSAVNVTVGLSGNNYSNDGWTYCASENGYCNFSGTRSVRFGIGSSYYYRTLTGGTTCSNLVFGDPAYGQTKYCYWQN